VARLAHPTLFSDDVIRIADLQTKPLGDLLFRPFNEHVAPIFEAVSWITWQLAGHRLAHAAIAFTLASLTPFLLSLSALCVLVYHETRSLTTALSATVLFSLSPVHAETIWWYSASSFTWALLGTLLTWLCVVRAAASSRAGRRAIGWWLGTVLAAAAAPACSAIGLLAGPLGALRLALSPGVGWRGRLAVLVPLAGTLLYLLIAGGTRYGMILGSSAIHSPDLVEGLLCGLRAPADVLVMGLAGLGNGDRWLSGGGDLALSGLLFAGAAAYAWRGRQRPMIVGGLALILGGYALTYGVRNIYGTHWLMEVQRYHLFPQLGFVLILAAAARPVLARFDARPRSSLRCATALAVLVLIVNGPLLRNRLRAFEFPDQHATLCTMERLHQICRDHEITRAQAQATFGPIRPRWFPHDSSVLSMLPDGVSVPRLSDEAARATLISSLSSPEREAICGGLDASALLQSSGPHPGRETIAVGRFVGAAGFAAIGPERWCARRGPAYLEFTLAEATGRSAVPAARWLSVPGSGPASKIEVWWTAQPGLWSETRSVHWRPAADRALEETAIPLDRLPHWRQRSAERLRVVVRSSGPVTLASPRLLR
jgi:hypothetical protein